MVLPSVRIILPYVRTVLSSVRIILSYLRAILPRYRMVLSYVRTILSSVRIVLSYVRTILPSVGIILPYVRAILPRYRMVLSYVRTILSSVRIILSSVRTILPRYRMVLSSVRIVLRRYEMILPCGGAGGLADPGETICELFSPLILPSWKKGNGNTEIFWGPDQPPVSSTQNQLPEGQAQRSQTRMPGGGGGSGFNPCSYPIRFLLSVRSTPIPTPQQSGECASFYVLRRIPS